MEIKNEKRLWESQFYRDFIEAADYLISKGRKNAITGAIVYSAVKQLKDKHGIAHVDREDIAHVTRLVSRTVNRLFVILEEDKLFKRYLPLVRGGKGRIVVFEVPEPTGTGELIQSTGRILYSFPEPDTSHKLPDEETPYVEGEDK